MTNKSVISAMLGIALMAMPITASARPNRGAAPNHRGPAPAFHPARTNFRTAPMPRFAAPPPRPMRPAAFRPVPPVNFAPRYNPPRYTTFAPVARPIAAPVINPVVPIRNNVRPWQAPPPANPGWVPPGHRRADYMWNRGHHEPDRDDFRTVCDQDGDDCRQVPIYNRYNYDGYNREYWKHHRYQYGAPAYTPSRYYERNYDALPYTCDEDGDDCRPNQGYDGGYSDIYGSNPQYYFMPMQGEAPAGYRNRLIYARDMAMMKYRRAMARGDHKAAKHLYNAVKDLNRRIAGADRRLGRGYNRYGYAAGAAPAYAYSGLGSYTSPYASSYGYDPYGYSNPGALSTIVGPILQNYVP